MIGITIGTSHHRVQHVLGAQMRFEFCCSLRHYLGIGCPAIRKYKRTNYFVNYICTINNALI